MMHRVVAGLLFLLSVAAIALSYATLYPFQFGWCPSPELNCLDGAWRDGVAVPVYWSTRWLPFFFFALIFVSKEVFQAWWKYALWFSIVTFILIFTTAPLGGPVSPNRTQVTEWLTQLFVMASALFIGWKYWQIRKAGKK